ncbi:hypothetical protein M9435_003434 [Picochlorum sp. BPE23]|nr:hypothetical protein M9435_003434 [Picochlorum sp. BPE23]
MARRALGRLLGGIPVLEEHGMSYGVSKRWMTSSTSAMWHNVDFQQQQTVGGTMLAGQPTPETHPYLMSPGDVQPGISGDEFRQRRRAFSNAMEPGSLAVLGSAPMAYMSGIIPYPYRPNSDHQYLTGIVQPDTLATIDSEGVFTVYCPDPSEFRDTWTGPLMSREAAKEFIGADEVHYVSEIPNHLARQVNAAQRLYLDVHANTPQLLSADHWRHALGVIHKCGTKTVSSLNSILHTIRWKKSESEIAHMSRSANIAAQAMMECMRSTRPGVSEHTLSALFEYQCRLQGAQRMSYPPVVGSGPDACTIHYSRNDKRMEENTLVLMDAGCEYFGYCSDVTRTWPIHGTFDGPGRDVYETVYEIHQTLLEQCKPGNTLRELHRMSINLIQKGLKSLSSRRGVHSLVDNRASYRTFYPHSVGHWLGLDTHDCSGVSHDMPLESGVILTIEPGIYIPDDSMFGEYRGIGVRIEDDVCITDDGPLVLSSQIPTKATDIERIMKDAMDA